MTKMSTNDRFLSCLNIFASFGFLALLGVLCGCASTKPTVTAAQYRFTLNDEVYRIRSITSSDNSLSYNELLGEKFLAIDFDQDRIIDRITIGTIELADAQNIYDYGLLLLSQENKLQERSPENHKYIYDDPNFYIEIKTFRPAGASRAKGFDFDVEIGIIIDIFMVFGRPFLQLVFLTEQQQTIIVNILGISQLDGADRDPVNDAVLIKVYCQEFFTEELVV